MFERLVTMGLPYVRLNYQVRVSAFADIVRRLIAALPKKWKEDE